MNFGPVVGLRDDSFSDVGIMLFSEVGSWAFVKKHLHLVKIAKVKLIDHLLYGIFLVVHE